VVYSAVAENPENPENPRPQQVVTFGTPKNGHILPYQSGNHGKIKWEIMGKDLPHSIV